MARKLSRIAGSFVSIVIAAAMSLSVASALGQSGVRVSSTETDVVNPFAARRQSPRNEMPTVTVPPAEHGVPKTFKNPFANRSAPPRFVTPQLSPGPLSRWHRPQEPPLPAEDDRTIQTATPSAKSDADRWDLLGPLARQEQRRTLFALPDENESAKTPTPPDPSQFGSSELAQPTWLAPNQVNQTIAREPVAVSPEQSRAVAQPPVDPFSETTPAEIVVSDDSPARIVRPLPPASAQDADQWYALAEKAAAAAATVNDLAAVVHLCQRGLDCGPERELAATLRSLAAWACNRAGELECDDRREDAALRAFELAIQWDPNCWLALHNRAVSRAQQGDLDGALADFNRALELNPGLAVAYRNRGELLAATGRTDEAVADYATALAQLSSDAELHAMRGHALHRLGRYEEALADLSQSIELAPHNAAVYAHRGNVFAEQGEFERAIADFRQALELDAESADALRSLAWVLATCPDARYQEPQHAVEAAEHAARVAAPGDPFVLDALAAAYASVGAYDRAVRYQQEAIANVPQELAEPFSARLALYEQRQPFRNGAGVSMDGSVRAASLEVSPPSPRQQ